MAVLRDPVPLNIPIKYKYDEEEQVRRFSRDDFPHEVNAERDRTCMRCGWPRTRRYNHNQQSWRTCRNACIWCRGGMHAHPGARCPQAPDGTHRIRNPDGGQPHYDEEAPKIKEERHDNSRTPRKRARTPKESDRYRERTPIRPRPDFVVHDRDAYQRERNYDREYDHAPYSNKLLPPRLDASYYNEPLRREEIGYYNWPTSSRLDGGYYIEPPQSVCLRYYDEPPPPLRPPHYDEPPLTVRHRYYAEQPMSLDAGYYIETSQRAIPGRYDEPRPRVLPGYYEEPRSRARPGYHEEPRPRLHPGYYNEPPSRVQPRHEDRDRGYLEERHPLSRNTWRPSTTNFDASPPREKLTTNANANNNNDDDDFVPPMLGYHNDTHHLSERNHTAISQEIDNLIQDAIASSDAQAKTEPA